MIEATTQAAADFPWARWAVSVVTLVALLLGLWGLLRAFTSTRRVARNVQHNVDLRKRLQASSADLQRIESDQALSEQERATALEAAYVRRRELEREAGSNPIPFQYDRFPDGSEPVAEALVDDLSSTTNRDLWIVGLSIVLGAAASIAGTWIP